MKKSVPPSNDLRNPRAHLDLAAGLPGSFEALFASLPAAEAPPVADLDDDGPHEPICPCWKCDSEMVLSEPDEDAAFDMARDLDQDRADNRWMS